MRCDDANECASRHCSRDERFEGDRWLPCRELPGFSLDAGFRSGRDFAPPISDELSGLPTIVSEAGVLSPSLDQLASANSRRTALVGWLPLPAALCAVLLLGSCAAHKGGWRDSVDVPAAWKSSDQKNGNLDTMALKKWWKRFGDSTLDDLVDKALASSPDIKTALSRIASTGANAACNSRVCCPPLLATLPTVSSAAMSKAPAS